MAKFRVLGFATIGVYCDVEAENKNEAAVKALKERNGIVCDDYANQQDYPDCWLTYSEWLDEAEEFHITEVEEK